MILEATGVNFAYGRTTVINDASISLAQGEMLGVVGPNGAGKTTLLKLFTGHYRPKSGSVRLSGAEVSSLPRREAALQLAYVPQRTEMEFPFSVVETVLMGRHAYAGFAALDTDEDVRAAMDALDLLGIAKLANRYVTELSGGEQQLVFIARALAQQAPVLVLDEPVTGLDMRHQWVVLEVLSTLCNRGSAVVATFHDLNLAGRFCSRIAVMSRGRMVASGAPESVFTSETLTSVYGIPLTVTKGEQSVLVSFGQ